VWNVGDDVGGAENNNENNKIIILMSEEHKYKMYRSLIDSISG
jgi:hypothetical protein